MSYGEEQFSKAATACNELVTLRRSLLEETKHQLDKANAEVTRLEELVKLLEENPTINRVLELLGSRY